MSSHHEYWEQVDKYCNIAIGHVLYALYQDNFLSEEQYNFLKNYFLFNWSTLEVDKKDLEKNPSTRKALITRKKSRLEINKLFPELDQQRAQDLENRLTKIEERFELLFPKNHTTELG